MTTFNRCGSVSSKELIVEMLATSQTWTVPDGVDTIFVWMCGAGGGGPRASFSSYNVKYYGASSGFSVQLAFDVTPGQQFPVVIGAGGVGGNASSSFGGNGGDTSFGSYTAKGGEGADSYIISSEERSIGGVYGASLYRDTSSTRSYGSAGPANPTEGDGAGYDYPGITPKGFCWMTNETYCGGGGLGYFYWHDSYPTSLSYPAIPNSDSGGGGVGPVSTTGSTVNTLGPGNAASKYGAAGGGGSCIMFNFVENSSDGGGRISRSSNCWIL